MKITDINTSSPYKAVTGSGLLKECGELIKKYTKIAGHAEKAAIITDDAVGPLYADIVEASLKEAGFDTAVYTLPNGEASKNIQSYAKVLGFLAESHITRSDFIVALGGGVIGDLSGFAAATFLRGIDFVQIPTTLLAAVDSSVGGKTGIDLDAGKNLAGAFYQPKLVICDMNCFDTLPDAVFTEGCAEIIKYGVLGDEELFKHLEKHGRDFDKEYVITRCIEMKRDIVCEDEFDTGLRQLLNLGHTLGHAVEKLSNFGMYHGMAVSVGMAVVVRASAAGHICSAETAERIVKLLKYFGLPTECEYGIDKLYELMQSEKKRRGKEIALVVPKAIADCEIVKMPLADMKSFMEKGI